MFQIAPKFTLDNTALDNMLHGPSGEVGSWLRKKGRIMEAAAARDVGVKSGRLRASIYRTHHRVPAGQQMIIGADAQYAPGKSYAKFHHDGTMPHGISGKNGGMLRFTSKGKVVVTRSVRHSGSKSNRFLTMQIKYLLTP